MTLARLKHFGWGREGEGLTPPEEAYVLERIEQRFGRSADGEVKPPRLDDIKLEQHRLDLPASLPFCSTEHYHRAAHTFGKSVPDYARGLVGDYRSAPDVVAYPRTENVAELDLGYSPIADGRESRGVDHDDDSVNKMEFRKCRFMSRMSRSCCAEIFAALVSH